MNRLKIENLPVLTVTEEAEFWGIFETELAKDDDSAARAHLEAGRPITYRAPEHNGALVREWPSGRIEIITAGLDGSVAVERVIVDI